MRKTTDRKGFASAVVITVLSAGLLFLLTAAMVTGYLSGFPEPLILFCR